MAFLLKMIDDFTCAEDKLPKRPPPYYPPISAESRQARENAKANPNSSQLGMSRSAAPPGPQGSDWSKSPPPTDWSRSPPQQDGKAPPRARARAQSAQSRARGVGASPDAQQANSRASRPPPSQAGSRQQQQQQPQRQQSGAGWYSQDEMNFRDVQQREPDSWQQQQQPPQQRNQQAQAAGCGQMPESKAQARQQQMRQRQENDDKTGDTIIGKGFTAAMKRGVSQAKPNALHEELVAQKDGGFISTIQRGFEGIFGKPTSKEEVLFKRGAVWANEYEAVPGDEIDSRVQFFARRLPEDVAGCLKLFRNKRGEYQINAEKVNMEIRYRQNQQGQTDQEIFVFWTTEEGEQSDPEPLGLYLSHAANVAFEVKQGGNVITQVPEHVRMSFHEEIGTKLTDGSADARFTAMEVAARQAKMREEAANEWRQRQSSKEVPDDNDDPRQGGMNNLSNMNKAEEPRREQERQGGPQRMKSVEAPQNSIIDDVLGAFGNLLQPPAAGASLAAPAAAPVAMPAMQQQQPMGGSMYAPSQYQPSQAGTFYGVSQAGPQRYLPQQGSMYAYGSAQPVMAGASGYPGQPVMAPMQRQGSMYNANGAMTMPTNGSMYAYGSTYPVQVR